MFKMSRLDFDRSVWTSIEFYNRWIEKAEAEVRGGTLLNSPHFQKNFLEIIAISGQLIHNCRHFKGPDIDMIKKVAGEIDALANNELTKLESGIIDMKGRLEKLGKIREKVAELKKVYTKIATGEFRKAA